jgi:hypothetical protein
MASDQVHAVDTDLFVQRVQQSTQPLSKRLQTHDQAELIIVLDEVAATAAAADADRDARAIVALLRAGQTDVVADHALEALTRLRSREGRDVLMAFVHHRRAEARLRAYAALAKLGEARDVTAITLGLRDSAPQVRNAVARSLASLPARGAVPDLLLALELGVFDAAAAIGKHGDAASLDRFSAQVGKLPLYVLLEGYANYLERQDLPDVLKLRIVATLEDVSGGVVKEFLTAWLARPDGPGHQPSPQLRQAVVAAASRVRRLPEQDTTAPASKVQP